ncbi:MAG: mercury resistance system transport protein MerF [Pseudomonadota bacterium]
MNDKVLLKMGVIGAIIVAICCVTPLFVITLGAVGLSAWLLWLDYAVFGALFLFSGLIGFALMKLRNAGE